LIMDNVAKYNLDDDFTLPIFQTGHYSDLDQLYARNNTHWDTLKELANNLAISIGDDSPLRYESTTVQGYYLVTTKKKKSLLAQVDPTLEFKDQSNNVKVSSPAIHRLSTQILETQLALNQLTKQKYTMFLDQISSEYADVLEHITIFTNNIDVCKSIAKVSLNNKYCRPVIASEGDNSFIRAESLRHPIIEVIDTTSKYIPNDVSIGKETDGMLLYGLNSSGKSTYGRSCGMAIILAMCGFYVPAQSFVYKPYNKIMTKIAIQDDLFKGKSTFINEMLELKNILEYSDSTTLVIADELCSGTEHSSALSIVASTVIELASRKSSFIFATHYHDLADLPEIVSLDNVKVFHTEVTIDANTGLSFNRKLNPGKCPDKYGIEIATYMNLPSEFITRALKIRSQYDKDDLLITPTKNSRYNSNIYIDYCKVCTATKSLVVHHILPQAEFIEGNCIPYRKNIEHNLVVLCESCHSKVHHTKTLIINGYIRTSQGLQLDYYTSDVSPKPKKSESNENVGSVSPSCPTQSPTHGAQYGGSPHRVLKIKLSPRNLLETL
jgi:DNA mismatch repair protein MutS